MKVEKMLDDTHADENEMADPKDLANGTPYDTWLMTCLEKMMMLVKIRLQLLFIQQPLQWKKFTYILHGPGIVL